MASRPLASARPRLTSANCQFVRPTSTVRTMFAWDGTGTGHLVWYEWDGAQYNMVARRILPTGEWEASITPIAADCGDTPEHSVEADRYGNVFLLWNQIDPADVNVRNVIVSRFDNTAGEWNTPLAGMDDTSPPNARGGKIAVS